MWKYTKIKLKKEQNKNRIQFKIKSINPIHQTNANRIIIVIRNDVNCESSLKYIKSMFG